MRNERSRSAEWARLWARMLFARNLPKIRVEARQLIIAQGMAGGEPVEEMSARGVQ